MAKDTRTKDLFVITFTFLFCARNEKRKRCPRDEAKGRSLERSQCFPWAVSVSVANRLQESMNISRNIDDRSCDQRVIFAEDEEEV